MRRRRSPNVRRVDKKEVKLDTTSRLTLTKALLDELRVPVSSQLLVFSGTASQGSRVNSKNPRALYFNDEVYVGLVPNGFVENERKGIATILRDTVPDLPADWKF